MPHLNRENLQTYVHEFQNFSIHYISTTQPSIHMRHHFLLSACLLLSTAPVSIHTSSVTGQVVQFAVYAPQETDVAHLFPGAQIDHTWNNVFMVSIWTNDPDKLIPDIQRALDSNAEVLQTIFPPVTLAAATRKWIEYNIAWVAIFVLMFLAGCACGGVVVLKYNNIKQDARGKRQCRT
jgi:hypothetical protein